MIDEESKEAAAHWRKLAKEEMDRLSWDKHLLPSIAQSRAATYEAAAQSIELGATTGIPHCACHLIPLAQCAELARRKR